MDKLDYLQKKEEELLRLNEHLDMKLAADPLADSLDARAVARGNPFEQQDPMR